MFLNRKIYFAHGLDLVLVMAQIRCLPDYVFIFGRGSTLYSRINILSFYLCIQAQTIMRDARRGKIKILAKNKKQSYLEIIIKSQLNDNF
jgi:hypothetical protein